jgi:hypothetical protein
MNFRRGMLVLLCVTSLSWAMKDYVFNAPKAFHAKTYPAHDAHDNEKVAIAADPYDMPDKTANVFTVNYKREGLLPVHFIISNDSGELISLQRMKVLLLTKSRAKIEPATPDDIYRRISRQLKRGDEPKIQLPIPIPSRGGKQTVSKQARAEVEGAQFMARAVEPHSTQAGFFFFDVQDIDNPVAGGRIEITGLRDSSGHELFYFEIPLEKYLNYQPLKQ